ncbi:claudin-1 [Microcaecilia unicolor]|uniref:Claudin-1-like n=1 Tax=Microcaecilia unicolor TaxID=1415580 RepID=A0A6P7Z678_9AMPH|nr:claudin-1-like [Microcaecilia unicolor]
MLTCTAVVGLILAPMGWVLLLAATVSPHWREFYARPGYSSDVSFFDGLWESCTEVNHLLDGRRQLCQAIPEEVAVSWFMHMLRSLTVLSLLGGLLGYWIANLGIHWWTDPPKPSPNVIGVAGLILILCGGAYLGAVSYMTHQHLENLKSSQVPNQEKFQLGTCLYLGWAGGTTKLLSGVAFTLCFNKQKQRGAPGVPDAPYEVDY